MLNSLSIYPEDAPFAFGGPVISGQLRSCPEDFIVIEELGFEPAGEGQHVLLNIEKRDTNTEWLARELQQFCAVKQVDVGFSGMKDRHALTSQWFSVDLAGKTEPDWEQFDTDNWRILSHGRHNRKLRRGTHRFNRFSITIRELAGNIDEFSDLVAKISQLGVPNYFGGQRFGHENMVHACRWADGSTTVKNRAKRGRLLSVLRAALFNEVLAERIRDKSWREVRPGDVVMFRDNASFFTCEEGDEFSDIEDRCAAKELFITGPMYGDDPSPAKALTLELEQKIAERHESWCRKLATSRLQHDRRKLVCDVNDVQIHSVTPTSVTLNFLLPRGAYATAVLRELLDARS